MRIELTYAAWKAAVLPLNYTRIRGDSEGTRTLDPLIKSQLLYRLSYRVRLKNKRLGQRDSNSRMRESKSLALPLGYAPIRIHCDIHNKYKWWRRAVSNHRTQREQIYSLPRLATSLRLHKKWCRL